MSKPPETRKALGKGLSALLPQRPAAHDPSAPNPVQTPSHDQRGTVREVPIADIDPNPLQPRSQFDQTRIGELAESIKANGIIQPLIVRRHGERFQLVAGERRLRAARVAGLPQVPVVIQDFADDQLLQLALIENIQREDLNPIETAQAFERLANDLNLTHEEIAHRTGKDRTTITNLLRLLRLPESIQLLLAERRLHMGHARAIFGVPNEEQSNRDRQPRRSSWPIRPRCRENSKTPYRRTRRFLHGGQDLRTPTSRPPSANSRRSWGRRYASSRKANSVAASRLNTIRRTICSGCTGLIAKES